MPEECILSLKKAVDKQLPMVVTSKCLSGKLFTNTYGFKGSEKDLRDIGVIYSDWLSTLKARIKLIVMLSSGLNCEKIKANFEKNFYQ